MTNIEWVKNPDGTQGITLNPLTGCKNHTPEGLCLDGLFPCYAWKLAHTRLKQRYLANHNVANWATLSDVEKVQAYNDPFYPRFWEERVDEIWKLARSRCAKARGIFVCDMGDLFGIGIPEEWTKAILDAISHAKPHRFYLLTKQPQNLIKFSPFPENCRIGVTATGYNAFSVALDKLKCVEAKTKYISIEPLLEAIPFNAERLAYCGISLLIIGACTGTLLEMAKLVGTYSQDRVKPFTKNVWTLQPEIEWLREIVEVADKAGVKVFLKDNLDPLLRTVDGQIPSGLCDNYGHTLRQEMPE